MKGFIYLAVFYMRVFILRAGKVLVNKRGEFNISNDNIPKSTYREVKIGRTNYRLTSIFEGDKDLDKTLERLAIKKATEQKAVDKKDINVA